MKNLAEQTLVGAAGSRKRSPTDFYPTPPDVTAALLDFLALEKGTTIWEPACGQGHMVRVMEGYGYCTVATDISSGIDFLTEPLRPCDWIITNPPFSQSEEFVWRCIEHGKPFALLLKSQYWHARRRLDLIEQYPPTYILPLTWRPDFLFCERDRGEKRAAPLMDVMWCVWQKPVGYSIYRPMRRPKGAKNENISNTDPRCTQ